MPSSWPRASSPVASSGTENTEDALIFPLCPYNIPFYLLSPFPGPCHPNPCHNNGECQLVPNRGDVFTDYICKCPAGYDGVHCQNSEYSRLGGRGGGWRWQLRHPWTCSQGDVVIPVM